tara:strand:- start:138 stop:323 length:186 start_codon:yes stop_codon:yes gene_type:complete
MENVIRLAAKICVDQGSQLLMEGILTVVLGKATEQGAPLSFLIDYQNVAHRGGARIGLGLR